MDRGRLSSQQGLAAFRPDPRRTRPPIGWTGALSVEFALSAIAVQVVCMNDPIPGGPISERIARCGCGKLSVAARGEPADSYLCSCTDCQRMRGSAFSYAAWYARDAVAVAGDHATWRRKADSGRWIDNHFCPVCGTTVFFHFESGPRFVGVAVGCFADPDFPPPRRIYWSSRRHRWLVCPAGVEVIDTQPG